MTRIHLLLMLLAALSWASIANAQDPQVSITADEQEVILGQPVLVQVEVLVPTFMPRAPVFPTFEVPGLIVRLPERSTLPISESVGGETWAGVRRTYRIYPMRSGETTIPAQELEIVYRDTASSEDVPLVIDVPPLTINAVVPPEARSLDPVILANQLTASQNWQVEDGALGIGDAVVRRLELSITGASPLFLPPLLETAQPHSDGPEVAVFSAYPEDPIVSESFAEGIISGTRSEQVSYIAQSGGSVTFPDITLRWYNVESGEIEDIVLPGNSLTVVAPPASRQPLARDDWIRISFWLIIAVGMVLAARRWLWPPIRAKVQALRANYERTAHAAHRRAVSRAKAHDLNGLLNALAERRARGFPVGDALDQSLKNLTRMLYSSERSSTDVASAWSDVNRTLRRDRPSLSYRQKTGLTHLPPLNAFSTKE